MKIGICKICKKKEELQKHHLIPKRIKKIDLIIYICKECHQRIHPENHLIIRIKALQEYQKILKKFLKDKYPNVWEEWKPIKKEFKEKFKEDNWED